MKTTLLLPDPLFLRIKQRAAAEGRTLSSLVLELLTKGLSEPEPKRPLPALPTFDTGRILVDVADRDALYEAMEGE
jgi:plasmid stability protein